jgi:DNA-binding response OmpR family regulator
MAPPQTTPLHAPSRVLVAEDQADIRDLLAMNLRSAGYEVDAVDDGVQALARHNERPADLLILDLMMPRMDGLEVCKALRQQGSATPILMLTAKSTELDRVLGLELGADDYLTKPFSLAELLARVKALLRRASLLAAAQASANAQSQQPKAIRNGELEILPAKRQVTWRGKAIDFTALEFDLLLHFASHPGHVFSRSQLLNAVWGYTHDGYEHTVTTHINRLRGKLEADPMRPELILTARGAGYKMRDEP